MFYFSRRMTEIRFGRFFYVTKRGLNGRVFSKKWGFV